MPLYSSAYPAPSRAPSYPLHSNQQQQQRIPDSYASSSTLGSYDLHSQPPLDAYANNYYPQQDIQRSYSPSPSTYTSAQQPIDYYSTDVSGSNGQHRRNPTGDSGTSSGEGAGYGRGQPQQDGYYAAPPPRGGSMHAPDGQEPSFGADGQQQQAPGYPNDYKGLYRPFV